LFGDGSVKFIKDSINMYDADTSSPPYHLVARPSRPWGKLTSRMPVPHLENSRLLPDRTRNVKGFQTEELLRIVN